MNFVEKICGFPTVCLLPRLHHSVGLFRSIETSNWSSGPTALCDRLTCLMRTVMDLPQSTRYFRPLLRPSPSPGGVTRLVTIYYYFLNAPRCSKMLQDAPRCLEMLWRGRSDIGGGGGCVCVTGGKCLCCVLGYLRDVWKIRHGIGRIDCDSAFSEGSPGSSSGFLISYLTFRGGRLVTSRTRVVIAIQRNGIKQLVDTRV